MRVTEQVIQQFDLPEESLGGFYSVRFGKIGGTVEEYYSEKLGRTAYRRRDAALTGTSEARLTMPNGLVFVAKAKKNKKDSFHKHLAHKLLSGRIKKTMNRYWSAMCLWEWLEADKAEGLSSKELDYIVEGFSDYLYDYAYNDELTLAELENIEELISCKYAKFYARGMEYARQFIGLA